MTRNTGHNTGLASGGLTFTAEISCRNSRPNAKPLPVGNHSKKTMTRNEKLDSILNGLGNLLIREGRGDKMPKEPTMKFMNHAMKLNMEKWEMENLQEQLVHDGYATLKGGVLRMTEPGRKFLAEKRGYVYQASLAAENDQIRKEPLNAAKRDRRKMWFIIATFIVALLTLLTREVWLQWLSRLVDYAKSTMDL